MTDFDLFGMTFLKVMGIICAIALILVVWFENNEARK